MFYQLVAKSLQLMLNTNNYEIHHFKQLSQLQKSHIGCNIDNYLIELGSKRRKKVDLVIMSLLLCRAIRTSL